MGVGEYAAILGVWLVAVASPGPDMLLVLNQSVVRSRRSGVVAAVGITAGIGSGSCWRWWASTRCSPTGPA